MMTHPRLSRSRIDATLVRATAVLLGLIALIASAAGFAQGSPSGEYGQIEIGGRVQATIAAATTEAFVFHTYVVQVLDGSDSITIEVDGMGSDLDLAVKVGAPIMNYDDVDFIDTSPEPNPTYTVQNAAGRIVYLDVLNLVQQAANYSVTVNGTGAASAPVAPRPGRTPPGQAQPSGEFGAIAIGSSVDGAIAAASDEALVFHTYWVDVPQSGGDLTIAIDGMGSDLDVALKVGAPIMDYEDVDFIDTTEDPNPIIVIEDVAAGRIYVDVLNLVQQPASYRVTVTAGVDAQPIPTPQPDRGSNPLAGDPLLGSFEGDGLTVRVQGGNGSYTGELILNGDRFAFQATGGNGRLDGSFTSGGQAFPFSATLSGDTLVVASGGGTYRTQRN